MPASVPGSLCVQLYPDLSISGLHRSTDSRAFSDQQFLKRNDKNGV